jgi:hypothetical protein
MDVHEHFYGLAVSLLGPHGLRSHPERAHAAEALEKPFRNALGITEDTEKPPLWLVPPLAVDPKSQLFTRRAIEQP